MTTRIAFVDEKLLAAEFGTGDIVRKTGLRDFTLTPYVGRVLYSNVDTGKVQVQWPWGAEHENPSELTRTHESHLLPPMVVDQSYSTHEQARNRDGKDVEKADAKWRKSLASRLVETYEERTKPLWRAACEAWHCEMPELEAFVKMASVYGDEYGTDAVRLTVSNLYETGRRLAIYWTRLAGSGPSSADIAKSISSAIEKCEKDPGSFYGIWGDSDAMCGAQIMIDADGNVEIQFVPDFNDRDALPVFNGPLDELDIDAAAVDIVDKANKCLSQYGQAVGQSQQSQQASRTAIYWKDNKRRYKVTQQEQESGRISCPRCKGMLKPRVYRQGHRMLMCNECGFSIHPSDLTTK